MLLFSYFVKFVMHYFLCVFRKMKSVPAVTFTPRACFSGEILLKLDMVGLTGYSKRQRGKDC